MEKVRKAAAVYFTFQGIGVIAWWGVLYFLPESRVYFQFEVGSQNSLMSFWLADLSFLGAGSIVAGLLCFANSEFKKLAAWFVTGAISYSAVYCLTFAASTDAGWLGVTLMFPAMIWSGVFSVGMTFETTMFRKSSDGSSGWIVFKTFAQIIVVWSIILVLFPYLITVVEDKLAIPRLNFPYQHPVAALLFIIISSLGVYAAYTMSLVGRGTPLPLDHAPNLVVRGPYSYVRNPMAVSGIGQGLAVALFLGSPLVGAYALMGSLIWQLIFRPLEEDDLHRRFGNEYKVYTDTVRCWIPNRSAYQIDGTADSSNSIVSPVGKM